MNFLAAEAQADAEYAHNVGRERRYINPDRCEPNRRDEGPYVGEGEEAMNACRGSECDYYDDIPF